MFRIGKSIEKEGRLVVASGWMEEGMGSDCLMSTAFSFGVMKMFFTQCRWWLHDIENVLNATELYTLKWLTLCYVNFTSIKKKKTSIGPRTNGRGVQFIRFPIHHMQTILQDNLSTPGLLLCLMTQMAQSIRT